MWNSRFRTNARIRRIAGHLLIAIIFAGIVGAKSSSAGTIADVLNQQPAFSDFVCLLKSQGLDAELGGTERFTIFAPINAAFDNIPPEVLQASSGEGVMIIERQAVRGLIVSSRWGPQDLAGKKTILKAMNGQNIGIDGTGGRLAVGDAEVLSVDVTPSNGVIYVIDTLTLAPY